ncbi:hypothetical protein C8R44DRAFT_881066 [Mycena epipterygia]|nr:hypothetical protein C8R44DRAFT_881066 [Mycena epipterygia]
MITDEFKPIPWPLEDTLDATIDEVIETMTLCSVSVAMVDDAWLFGYNFMQKPQSTPSESKGSSSPAHPSPKVEKGKACEQPLPFTVASVSQSHVAHPTPSRHKTRTSTPATLIISTGSAPPTTGIPRISLPVASLNSNSKPTPIMFSTIPGPSRLANLSAGEPPLNNTEMLPYDDAPPQRDEDATDAVV